MSKIEQLLPLLKKGWVAMDKNGAWWWFECMPQPDNTIWLTDFEASKLSCYPVKDIEPAKDWTKSLRRCGDE